MSDDDVKRVGGIGTDLTLIQTQIENLRNSLRQTLQLAGLRKLPDGRKIDELLQPHIGVGEIMSLATFVSRLMDYGANCHARKVNGIRVDLEGRVVVDKEER